MRAFGMSADSARPRIAALEVLPVFMQLRDRTAVVAGDTAAAAWKAELLAASGAHVRVYAEMPCEEMRVLLARGGAAGTLAHIARPWAAADLADAALAVCDAESEDEADAFAVAGRAAGVPVNVIDRPRHCTVNFGAIVNRSPVVVGISTAGASPILGQAVRRRIETVLPQALGAWAALAKRLRARVAAWFPLAASRRGFWEALADRAFRAPAPTDDEAAIAELATSADGRGRVTLVGAGPGDAGLLTLKAVQALQSADVILFDHLVSDEVLELARREAKRMLVGKRAGRPSCRQEEINTLMMDLARQGKRVVRLKSGDPGIFGRGGEELDELARHGIPVEVVPGITAAVALAARLGVSLTHRAFAHSVRFVTGHSRDGSLPDDLDWRGLADPETTTVFYMAGRTAAAVADRLIAEGLSPSTPLAIVASVSRPDERRWYGSLATAAAGIEAIGYESPVLVAIGRAFAGADVGSILECDGSARRTPVFTLKNAKLRT